MTDGITGAGWPTPPTNVQAHYVDGRVVPLDLVYEGPDRHGAHHWTTATTLPETPAKVTCDTLPHGTAISLALPS